MSEKSSKESQYSFAPPSVRPSGGGGCDNGCTIDLHSRGILQVIHTRDCLFTWSDSLYSIGQGS